MEIALMILMALAAADLFTTIILLAVVSLEYRRLRKAARAAGEPMPSAAGQLGCLFAFAVLGLVVIYVTAWLLFIK
jgi:hypothetical protein